MKTISTEHKKGPLKLKVTVPSGQDNSLAFCRKSGNQGQWVSKMCALSQVQLYKGNQFQIPCSENQFLKFSMEKFKQLLSYVYVSIQIMKCLFILQKDMEIESYVKVA